jgi:hypothetical protein
MIKDSKDPEVDLRKEMVVEIVDKHTYLIRVSLASPDPQEAAMIVNAVVDAYMEQHNEYHRNANKELRKSLTYEYNKLDKEIRDRQANLKTLVENSQAHLSVGPAKRVAASKDDLQNPSFEVISEDQYAQVAGRLIQADLELIDAQVKLEIARHAQKSGGPKAGDQPGTAKATAEETIRELEAAVNEVKEKRIGYMRYLESVKVQSRAKDGDALIATIVPQELESVQKMKDIVSQKLEQLTFEEKQDVYRITQHDRASVPKAPANDKRLEYTAGAGVGVLFLLIGWFLMLEVVKGDPVAPRDRQKPMPPNEWDA